MNIEEITLSSGVVLNMWAGSPLAMDSVTQSMKLTDPVPQPPVVHSEEKDRDEPNPNDPGYLTALNEWNARLSIRLFTVLLATASKVKSTPEGMITHDSDEFIEILEMSGVIPRHTDVGLYVQWVMILAAKKDDQELLGTQLLRLAGLSESDIAEAEATFRGLSERDSDQAPLSSVNGSDRDRVPAPDSGVSV